MTDVLTQPTDTKSALDDARRRLSQAYASLNAVAREFIRDADPAFVTVPDTIRRLRDEAVEALERIDTAKAAVVALVDARRGEQRTSTFTDYHRKLNELVAREVMGLQVRISEAPSKDRTRTNRFPECSPTGEDGTWRPLPNYLEPVQNKAVIQHIFDTRTEPWGAWRMGQTFTMKKGDVVDGVKWWAAFTARSYVETDTLELAVCLAALREVRAMDALKELAGLCQS